MELIDTHCHLSYPQFIDDLPAVLERAQAAGVRKIINVACDISSALIAIEQLQISDMLSAAIGIQPYEALEFCPKNATRFKQLIHGNKKIIAIGEIGLDAYKPATSTAPDMQIQLDCFDYFLKLALDVNLPVIVHVRETHKLVYDRLAQFAKLGGRGVIHCFTGTMEEAQQFLDCGFYLSFAGIVTFNNAKNLQAVAKVIYLPETSFQVVAASLNSLLV